MLRFRMGMIFALLLFAGDLAYSMRTAHPGRGHAVEESGPAYQILRPFVPGVKLARQPILVQPFMDSLGGFGLADLLNGARLNEKTPYAACLIMAGYREAAETWDIRAGQSEFLDRYRQLLDYLESRAIPVIVSESLPLVGAAVHPGLNMPPDFMDSILRDQNQMLRELALRRACAIVHAYAIFQHRNTARPLGTKKIRFPNGTGPYADPNELRSLARVYTRALCNAGYRGGCVLLLADRTIASPPGTPPEQQIASLMTDELKKIMPVYGKH